MNHRSCGTAPSLVAQLCRCAVQTWKMSRQASRGCGTVGWCGGSDGGVWEGLDVVVFGGVWRVGKEKGGGCGVRGNRWGVEPIPHLYKADAM